MTRFFKYTEPVAANTATGLVQAVYTQIKRDFKLVAEPFTLHSPSPALLAGLWGIFRESLAVGTARRAEKEAVAVAVSQLNQCPWCVDAHSSVLYGAGHADIARSLNQDGLTQEANGAFGRLAAWAGATSTPGSPLLTNPPFPAETAPEFIGTAVTFHFLTRMVNVFLIETPMPTNPLAKALVQRVGGFVYAQLALKQELTPGDSAHLLAEAPLPDDLAWARPAPHIAHAFASMAAAVQDAADDTLPDTVQARVRSHIQAWDGSHPGVSRSWIEPALAGLSDEERALTGFSLLTGLAAYQVDQAVVDEFRSHRPGDTHLVNAAAFGAFTAARQMGQWPA
jgi:AhpD family alkylhydroperoxidase